MLLPRKLTKVFIVLVVLYRIGVLLSLVLPLLLIKITLVSYTSVRYLHFIHSFFTLSLHTPSIVFNLQPIQIDVTDAEVQQNIARATIQLQIDTASYNTVVRDQLYLYHSFIALRFI